MSVHNVEIITDETGGRRVEIERVVTNEELVRSYYGADVTSYCQKIDEPLLKALSETSKWCLVNQEREWEEPVQRVQVKSIYKEFISPEARADATVESVVDYSDLSAMQPVAACRCGRTDCHETRRECLDPGEPECVFGMPTVTAFVANPLPIPQTVTMPTGRVLREGIDYNREGIDYCLCEGKGVQVPPCEKCTPRLDVHREGIHVKWQKRDDLDAAMLKECRAALAKLREWPRCKDHDAPMAVHGAWPTMVEVKCRECNHHKQIAVKLSPKTQGILTAQSWTAPEFRT